MFLFRVGRANDIVVCSPVCPRPTPEPFRLFFGFGEQTTLSFARPSVLVRPQTLSDIFRVWRANDIVVSSPVCRRPTTEPFRIFFGLGEQTTMSFARPSVLVRPSEPFRIFFGFGELTTMSFASPACRRPTNEPFRYFSGLTSKRHCRLLARLSSSDP